MIKIKKEYKIHAVLPEANIYGLCGNLFSHAKNCREKINCKVCRKIVKKLAERL